MKPLAMVGVILIVLGLAGLVFGRFSYMTDKKVIDVGPVTATVGEEHHFDVPDVAGVVAVVAGTLLVFASRRQS
jgi:hypothetical protein